MTDHLTHLRFLENMEKVDRAIRRADGLEQMLEDTMRTVLPIFEADRVWLFYPCDPDAEIYTVPMECTRPGYPGAHSMEVNVTASPALRNVCREMLEAEVPVSFGAGSEKPVPEEQQAQFSVKSILCMSIFPKLGAPWAVGMHQCSRERKWSEDERRLFQEIGRRLADGLSSFLSWRDLLESQEKYRALFECSADAMLLIDGDTFVDCNAAAVQMLRCKSKNELLQMHPWDISPEFQADGTPSRKGVGETLASMPRERSRRFEWIHRRADGELFPAEVLLTYIPLGEKSLVHVVWRDLTDRERLIKKLESQNTELERFTYTVSHDLKSPLITIKGFLGVLEQDLGAHCTGEISEHLARIGTAADRMFAFLDNLLELSRVGRLVNTPGDIRMAELIDEAVDLVGGPIAAGHIQVCVARNLPVIRGDRVRLREVYQNLIENAVKYMGDQPSPKIEIGIRRDTGEKVAGEKVAGEETVFFVRDNGIGIDPRFQDKIFELFDKLNPKTEGTGVGLSLVSRILEVHGGRIWLESEGEGTGSTFCFTLASPK